METLSKNMAEEMVTIFPTLDIAEGTIEARADQQERLDELTDRLAAGEFHQAVAGSVPSKCIDGRLGAGGLAPNTALAALSR